MTFLLYCICICYIACLLVRNRFLNIQIREWIEFTKRKVHWLDGLTNRVTFLFKIDFSYILFARYQGGKFSLTNCCSRKKTFHLMRSPADFMLVTFCPRSSSTIQEVTKKLKEFPTFSA